MKTTDYLIITATLAYSYLFFQQGDGLNYFLFSILLVIFTVLQNKALLGQKSWRAAAAGTIISGFSVFHYGTDFTTTANILSVMALAAVSFNPEASLFISAFHSFYSYLLVIPTMIIDAVKPRPEGERGWSLRKIFLLILPLFISFLFFLLYRSANPLFEEVSNRINFDFLSSELFWFTVWGLVLMYGFFRQRMINWLSRKDSAAGNELAFISEEEHNQSAMARLTAIGSEVFTATALFVLLNLLLLAVNATDVYYLYIVQRLPGHLSLSQYLHDGTNSLIVSIVFAIAVILFYFRGRINFISGNRVLRWLAYSWVGQNIFLIFSTANRNWFYISHYGLTHRRIGVYVFLALCIAGLLTAFIKVARVKTSWYLLRRNSWVAYATLVLATLVNWDAVIAGYNLELAYDKQVKPDTGYLGQLGTAALPTLLHYYRQEQEGKTPARYIDEHLEEVIQEESDILVKQQPQAEWQSLCMVKQQAVRQAKADNKLAVTGSVSTVKR